VAKALGVAPAEVLLLSTGVIGRPLKVFLLPCSAHRHNSLSVCCMDLASLIPSPPPPPGGDKSVGNSGYATLSLRDWHDAQTSQLHKFQSLGCFVISQSSDPCHITLHKWQKALPLTGSYIIPGFELGVTTSRYFSHCTFPIFSCNVFHWEEERWERGGGAYESSLCPCYGHLHDIPTPPP